MNNTSTNDHHFSDVDVVKITERENSGVLATSTSRITIGYILSGTKYLYYNDNCYAVNEGELFLLDAGHHYIEHIVGENGRFEQIKFCLNRETLQRVIFALNINYGISFSSIHSCPKCSRNNFAIEASHESLRNFFLGIDLSLRNSGLLHNDIGQRIKLNELIYLILTNNDSCMRRKIVRSADTLSGQFMNTIYDNIFNDISIEELADQTHRSLTSFKKEFRKLFNMPPHRWIVEQRLMRAKIMLSSTNYTVSEIGVECGFSNISHFIKLFKQRYRTTPALFRREHPTVITNEYRRVANG